MSVLSFCVECVDHTKIPLESIPKFFYGQRVGIVSWIDVVEYINVCVNGAFPQDNLRRLYVHFEKNEQLLERSDLFTQGLSLGNNVWKIGGRDEEICITITINKNPEHTKKNEATTYAFAISGDVWPGTYDNTNRWKIYEILGEESVKYTNLYDDRYNMFQYLEESSFPDPLPFLHFCEEGKVVCDNSEEYEERRLDLWNPDYNYKSDYCSDSGAVGFTQQEFKDFYHEFWKHYWDNSGVLKKYYPVISTNTILSISITIGPFFQPHTRAIGYLIEPIKEKIETIEDIYYDYQNDDIDMICEMQKGHASYFVTNMNATFNDITIDDFKTIKNALLDIEHICEIIKPKDIYGYIPESRIYINFH